MFKKYENKEWVKSKSLLFLMCGVAAPEHLLYEVDGRLFCWYCGAMFNFDEVNITEQRE